MLILPLRDLVLLSLAVSVPFSVGSVTGAGLWLSLGWLCLGALAVLLLWRQPGTIAKGLAVLAAYLLVMSGRSVGTAIAVAQGEDVEGTLLLVAVVIVALGVALAIVGIGLYRRKGWALWGALVAGLIALFNIAQSAAVLGEPGVGVAIIFSVAVRALIWIGVIVFTAYLLRNRELLQHAI